MFHLSRSPSLPRLKQMCELLVLNFGLDCENVSRILSIAHRHMCSILKRGCINYIVSNFPSVVKVNFAVSLLDLFCKFI